jgi:hypothetical protein
MELRDKAERLDRHALVLAIWLPLGLVAVLLLRLGLGGGGAGWILGGFGAIVFAFAAHLVVNAALGRDFTMGERMLGLVLFAVALLAFGLALVVVEGFAARFLAPFALGFGGLAMAILLYMVTRHGARGAFEGFDVIRRGKQRPAARLPHRGGRR